ncbi:citrate lyase acyl carrier protein [Sporosalibacterium faouarense]|uniref:citrate lyase acyl carrier protein n=1 Tax=Sporosalibacterium faouarense TaxID=516123 RepID=UPI00141C7476|nr:citrate lyase acyl carrier protein [Sporosalibacterium faouarense]MTI49327.1 citrate lyase acyl carrier protein [Bacillota bacterium]
MKIQNVVMAGSLESNDVLVTLRPTDNDKLFINLESIVQKQFANRIKKIIDDMLNEFNVESGDIHVQDRGALDCTLRARLETALSRAEEGR